MLRNAAYEDRMAKTSRIQHRKYHGIRTTGYLPQMFRKKQTARTLKPHIHKEVQGSSDSHSAIVRKVGAGVVKELLSTQWRPSALNCQLWAFWLLSASSFLAPKPNRDPGGCGRRELGLGNLDTPLPNGTIQVG